ncbi:MAG: hypothetical protein H0Z40_05280 [Desulfotomaculum sp.]|nr:hypothetical protein [Desulfotomaculum sp.]
MVYYNVPSSIQHEILTFSEHCLGISLTIKANILFPNSVYITDTRFDGDHPEKFILIFDVKENYFGITAGHIRYFQIPLHLRHRGLAKKIYYELEKQFKIMGCEIILVEATIDCCNQSHTTVSFWKNLNFKKLYSYLPEDDTCPMYKYI